MQQNTLQVSETVVKIANKERPFSNNFVQRKAEIVQFKGKDEIRATVLCTENSNEPGRIYATAYTMQGKMLECFTLN